MPDKFKDRYRIPSTRHPHWDYGWDGGYFITICTHNREHYFGEIIEGEMQLSDIGQIVHSEWIKTPYIRPDMNLELDVFAIMPNHFHAIINICENQYNTQNANIIKNDTSGDNRDAGCRDTRCKDAGCRDAMHRVSTLMAAMNFNDMECKNKFAPQRKNLASIIRGFKSAVTNRTRKFHADFAWQSRYHDHIIRNDDQYKQIKNYILNNPENWDQDKYF